VTGQTATGGSVRSRSRVKVGGSTAGWAPKFVLVAAVAGALLLGAGAASADPGIQDKQAQAQAIMAELQNLDSSLAVAIEAYNYANVELDRIDGELDVNERHLVAARKSLNVAQARIAKRLRDIYVNGDGDTTLEVLLGSKSLDDIIARIDAIERVSSQDSRILTEVREYRRQVHEHRDKLKDARAEQAQQVADRAAQKASIESQLAERQRLLASVKDEIARMQAEERRRQAELAAQARARLEAQRLAAQQAAQVATAESTTAAATFETPYDIPAPPPPDGSKASQVIAIAMQYLGVPYVWGGASPSQGFDCSGLTTYAFAQIGVSLPHHAATQYNYGTPVSRDDLQPADLVFFNGLGHMGMYIGGGQFIHAPHTGDVVKISSINDSWYAATWVGARRIL
jgi:cell wall-associated NlpC family hydrolase